MAPTVKDKEKLRKDVKKDGGELSYTPSPSSTASTSSTTLPLTPWRDVEDVMDVLRTRINSHHSLHQHFSIRYNSVNSKKMEASYRTRLARQVPPRLPAPPCLQPLGAMRRMKRPLNWNRLLDDPVKSEEKRQSYRLDFENAWTQICKVVEAEVIDLIGLPEAIYIIRDGDTTEGILPAWYDAKTRSLYFRESEVSPKRIRHEFGHHIEEQGPVEIWLGLVSLLNWFSEEETAGAAYKRRANLCLC